MLKEKHKNLPLFQKKVKILYISELMEKDEQFDTEVTNAFSRALKRCPALSKAISFEELDENAKLDVTHPIE